MSVRTVAGNEVVWIEDSGFTNAQLKEPSVIAQYIATHIGEVYRIIESGQKVYIGKDLPGEYTHSKYTSYLQRKNTALLKAKNRASTSLGEMIEIATNRRWEATKHKASKDAKYGMYRFDTKFAFPIKDMKGNTTDVKAFRAELLIRNASNGKKYLYDIVNIKEDTADALDLRHKEARKGSYKAATQSGVGKNNVAQNADNVKKNNKTEALPPLSSLLRASSGVPNASEGSAAQDADRVKEKFSDRYYSYEALTSKPDMEVTTVGGAVPSSRADVVFQAKQNAAKVGKFDPKTGSVSVHVDDIDADVLLGTDGLKHGLRRTKDAQNDANYIVTLHAGEIIKNSIKINEANPKKQNATGAYVLIGTARNQNGEMYIVRSVVNEFENELTSMDVLYAINAKKELAAPNAPRSTAEPLSVTSSTISIAELLDYVNQYFPDILPEDVLKHYEYDSRPGEDFGENVLYSDRDYMDAINNGDVETARCIVCAIASIEYFRHYSHG